MFEKLLLQRLKTYLEQSSQKTIIDTFLLTRGLREIYPEYANQKFDIFRKFVSKAFRKISKSCGLHQPFSEDEEGGEETLYTMGGPPGIASKRHPNELINILSSDESDDETPAARTPVVRGYSDRKKRQSSPGNVGILKKPRLELSNSDHFAKSTKAFNVRGENNRDEQLDFLSGSATRLSKSNNRKILKKTVFSKFHNVGGMEKILKELCENLIHFKCPEIYQQLGIRPPHGILIHGENGCGKTLLAHAIAGQLKYDIIELPAIEVLTSSEPEDRLREYFMEAILCSPCVLFIDDIELLSSAGNGAETETNDGLLLHLIFWIDYLTNVIEIDELSVLLVGATSRPEKVNRALMRRGRFDYEIAIPIPKRKDRVSILTTICNEVRVDRNVDFDKLADLTAGYVGADLLKVVVCAGTLAAKRMCTNQMYEFKKKVESNMDVVDLEDDDVIADPNTKEMDAFKSELAKDKPDNKVANDTDGEIDKTDNTEKEGEKSVTDKEENNKEVKEKENDSTSKKEEIAECNEIAKKEPATSETTGSNGTLDQKSSGPSLVELTNWLEYMPEDNVIEDSCKITFDDLYQAVKITQPSIIKSKRFLSASGISWDDVGGLHDIREKLNMAIIVPNENAETFEALGINIPSSILVWGPPGCGKSMVVKAVASASGMNIICVKGAQIKNMCANEGDRAIRECFQTARSSAPCIVYFDYIDEWCFKHVSKSEIHLECMVNQLLIEMDKVDENKGVYIIASASRPDVLNPLLLTRARFSEILYAGLPNRDARVEIMQAITKKGSKPPLADDVDIDQLAEKTDGFTGTDLSELIKQAAHLVFRERISSKLDEDIFIHHSHFLEALKITEPSLTDEERQLYEVVLKEKIATKRTTFRMEIE